MYELINKVPVKIKEYKGQRVVTFKDIDTVHNRPEGTAHRNFKANRKHFIEGEDFFFVKPADIQKDEFRPFGFEVPNRGLILLTENGYLMLVKSFTDDLAWEVQRQLVNTYFRIQSMNIYSDLESIIDKKIDKKLDSTLNRASTDIIKTILPCFEMLYNSIEDTKHLLQNIIIMIFKDYM